MTDKKLQNKLFIQHPLPRHTHTHTNWHSHAHTPSGRVSVFFKADTNDTNDLLNSPMRGTLAFTFTSPSPECVCVCVREYIRDCFELLQVLYLHASFLWFQANDGHHTEDHQYGLWDSWWWASYQFKCPCVLGRDWLATSPFFFFFFMYNLMFIFLFRFIYFISLSRMHR